ncbi:MAG TPA: hypothetical protein VJ044_03160 [Candidatus Hodarchaeales archaeon]|nr:hypothetical protein [Candidatus Hodarchaeales archaeon]
MKDKEKTLAIIVYNSFHAPGVNFLTPGEFSQQLAYISHPTGKKIDAHMHHPVSRTIQFTQEVLIIKRGSMRVDFFDNERRFIESRVLSSGDVILLASGGHGFEMLEETVLIEVKQGPYAGDKDKTKFVPKL